MSERKKANKNHPKYNEYIKKAQDLHDRYYKVLDEIEKKGKEKYPNWRGLDGPPEYGILAHDTRKKLHAEFNALKKQYAEIFTENIEEG